MRFNRTVAQAATAFAASAVVTGNLPVNPMSHLVLQYRFLNVTDEGTLAEILATLANIEVLYNGAQVAQYNGDDLLRLNMHLFGATPIQGNQVATDDAARWISLIVPFSPKLYDPMFGLPQSKSGTMSFRLTRSASDAAISDQTIAVEAIEMLGAAPEKTMKVTTITPPAGATGDNIIDLPREGQLAGILHFATTVPTSTAFTKTINSIKLLADNTEAYITLANWEAMRGEHAWLMGQEKGHVTADGVPNDNNYIYTDLDPLKDGRYLLDTEPLNDLRLIVNQGDTNAQRHLPVRYVPTERFAQA